MQIFGRQARICAVDVARTTPKTMRRLLHWMAACAGDSQLALLINLIVDTINMLTVIETRDFLVWSAKVWTDDEREEFVDWISRHPEAGDLIPGAGGCRKVRWSRGGMGKRGGARVIYYLRLANGQIVLMLVYAKSKFDSISTTVLAKLKEKHDVEET